MLMGLSEKVLNFTAVLIKKKYFPKLKNDACLWQNKHTTIFFYSDP